MQNRSLFIDEANLARNIVEKSIPYYFDSLDYEQYAPPLFLVETKLVSAILGVRDYSFRVVPLISGIASLIVLFLLLREWQEESLAQIYALGLVSFSILAIRYGTEFKQYSSDALLALLLVWLAWKDRNREWEVSRVWFWIVFGVLTIWYSMPSIFVLSGVGLYFMVIQRKQDLARWLFVMGSWALSFGLYYFLVLSKDVFDSNLQNHHAEYFIQPLASSAAGWKANGDLIVTLFKSITDKTAVPVGFGILVFATGLIDLYRTDKPRLFLLLTPLLAVILASSLQLYSFIPRMTLFILPLMILIMAAGLSYAWSKSKLIPRVIIVGLVVLSLINKEGYKHLIYPIEIEELKPGMKILQKEVSPDDHIYVHHEAVPAFEFYNNLSAKPFHLANVHHSKWNLPYKRYFASATQPTYWLVFCHATTDNVLKTMNSIDALGTSELIYEDMGSSVYRFEFN